MATPPPIAAESAFLGATSTLIRRCEIYEADAVTLWTGGGSNSRLIDGSVSIDYARDERRSVDLTLDNGDRALRHDPNGFWYDKILKVFHGVEYWDTTPVATTYVFTNRLPNPRFVTGASASSAGTGWAMYPTDFSYAVVPGKVTATKITAVGTSNMYVLASVSSGTGAVPASVGDVWRHSIKVTNVGSIAVVLYMRDQGGLAGSTAGPKTTLQPGVTATISMTGPRYISGTYNRFVLSSDNFAVGASIEISEPMFNNDTGPIPAYFDGASVNGQNVTFAWTGTVDMSPSERRVAGFTDTPVKTRWETQVGEFMIDQLEESNFPSAIKVTGRDYTKRCMVSKFVLPTAFSKGTSIEAIIRALAANSGISKFLLPTTGITTDKDFFFERGSDRWAAMVEIATAYSYDLYFDAQGYLVMTKYNDPVYAPLAYTLQTGKFFGNLVSFSKSTNDSRLYNHIVVTGESSDKAVVPVMAEAKNTEPSSPSRIARIGDRVFQYTTSFVTTTAQAQQVATDFLRVNALEEYDLNFSMITLPWLEVGQIVEFLDPDAGPQDPTRFLLSSLTIPLGLGPMSGNAKRVTVVG